MMLVDLWRWKMRAKRVFKYIPVTIGLYLGLVLSCWFGLAEYADIPLKLWCQFSAVVAIALCDVFLWTPDSSGAGENHGGGDDVEDNRSGR